MAGEELDLSKPYRFVDPIRPWKQLYLENCTAKKLQIQVIREGKRCYETEKLSDIASRVRHQLQHEVWVEEQRFQNPHAHYLDMSPSYYEMKMELLAKNQ
jgi:nicotinate phosphoribosyltransferase